MDPKQIFEQVREDHERVLQALAALERAAAAPGGDASGAAARALDARLAAHVADEDGVLLPALARALPEGVGRIRALRAEHAELRSMLAALVGLLDEPASGRRDEQVAVQVQDLADLLRIHMRKEEAVVFSVAERVLGPREIEALAARLSRGAGRPPTAPPTGA